MTTATNNDTVYEKVIESTTELATETLKPRILFTPGHFIFHTFRTL